MSLLGRMLHESVPDETRDPLAGARLERLRRRLDRLCAEVADLAAEAAETDLSETPEVLGRCWRLLALVAGPADAPPDVFCHPASRPGTGTKEEGGGSRNLNCPDCDHQIESVPGIAEYDCPQCGCRFYDDQPEEE